MSINVSCKKFMWYTRYKIYFPGYYPVYRPRLAMKLHNLISLILKADSDEVNIN